MVGMKIDHTVATSPHQAFHAFYKHNGSSYDDNSAWQTDPRPGVWMHSAKPNENGEYAGEWVQKMIEPATGIWWISPSNADLNDSELLWTLLLEGALLRPLASFLMTELLVQVQGLTRVHYSRTVYEIIVREWVYAFLWEVLVWSHGFAVPIPVAWKDLPNLRELLAVVYMEELGLLTWVSHALKKCKGQEGKIFCTNLFGIVAFILGVLSLENSGYSLSPSFTESISTLIGSRKALKAPACFVGLCPLVVRDIDQKELSLFQCLQELLGNSDASSKLAVKFDMECRCNWKGRNMSKSLVAGLFEGNAHITENFHTNLISLFKAGPEVGTEVLEGGPKGKADGNSASGASEGLEGGPDGNSASGASEVLKLGPDGNSASGASEVLKLGPEAKAVGNSASGANEGVGKDELPPVHTVEQGSNLRQKNVLLLGMTHPKGLVADLINSGDKRDLARCTKIEEMFDANVYTVSMATKGGVLQNERHLAFDFSNKGFIKNLKDKFGAEIVFDQVVLDYIWMPDCYVNDNMKKAFYEIVLPNLPSLLKSQGKIFLPGLPSICINLMAANDKLKEHYEITFRGEADLDDHLLWKATQNIAVTMEDTYMKENDQLKAYADLAKKLSATSSPEVRKEDIDAVCACINGVPKARMICLSRLGLEQDPEDMGGMQCMNPRKRKKPQSTKNAKKPKVRKEEEEEEKEEDAMSVASGSNEANVVTDLCVAEVAGPLETPQEGSDTGIQGPTKTGKKDNQLVLDGMTAIYPQKIHPKGEMLLAPCDQKEFVKGSSTIKFDEVKLSEYLTIYICDFIPVSHLKKMTNFHDSSSFQKRCERRKNNIYPYDVKTSSVELANHLKTNKDISGAYYPYITKRLGEEKFSCDTGSEAHSSVVADFLLDISKGLQAVIGDELSSSDDLEIHGVCIETVKPSHQRGHLDHKSPYEMEKRSFIGHMPLNQEGIVLRLENISSEMRDCLLKKESNLDEKVDVVDDILYIHVPFGAILVIDDRTFHGGHYGNIGAKRFHFVVSPKKWQDDKKEDSLWFLLESARQHTKKWSEKKKRQVGEWDESNDPQVPQPQLKIDTLDHMSKQIKYHKRQGYYESFVEHCYPENSLDDLKKVSQLIPDYKPQVFKDILSAYAEGKASSSSSSS
jgi:hypothetical protein